MFGAILEQTHSGTHQANNETTRVPCRICPVGVCTSHSEIICCDPPSFSVMRCTAPFSPFAETGTRPHVLALALALVRVLAPVLALFLLLPYFFFITYTHHTSILYHLRSPRHTQPDAARRPKAIVINRLLITIAFDDDQQQTNTSSTSTAVFLSVTTAAVSSEQQSVVHGQFTQDAGFFCSTLWLSWSVPLVAD